MKMARKGQVRDCQNAHTGEKTPYHSNIQTFCGIVASHLIVTSAGKGRLMQSTDAIIRPAGPDELETG